MFKRNQVVRVVASDKDLCGMGLVGAKVDNGSIGNIIKRFVDVDGGIWYNVKFGGTIGKWYVWEKNLVDASAKADSIVGMQIFIPKPQKFQITYRRDEGTRTYIIAPIEVCAESITAYSYETEEHDCGIRTFRRDRILSIAEA